MSNYRPDLRELPDNEEPTNLVPNPAIAEVWHWKHRAETAEAERDKALAACAEMRFLLGEATRMLANYNAHYPEDRQRFYSVVQQRCDSTSCGTGWLSPDKAKVLRDALERIIEIRPYERCNDVGSIARNALASIQ